MVFSLSPRLILWTGLASMAVFVGTLAVIPLLVVRIPEDYFIDDHRPPWSWCRKHPLLYLLTLVLKNLLGLFFLAAGFVMLFVPGQGVITLLLGLTLMNFPGKRRFEKAIIRQPAVHGAVNWMRSRGNHPPLQVP